MTFSTLDPQGPGAAQIATLWWVVLGLGAAVYLVVLGLFLFALWRGQQPPSPGPAQARRDTRLIVWGGIILPALVLVVLFVFTANTLRALSTTPVLGQELVIQVVGRQWWWEIRYPQQGIETANELHLPAGQPVKIELLAQDVIHSFWVPQLQGKLDMIPGQVNELWLQADQVGEYGGLCAEFCGMQHAKMAFRVVAQTPAEFATWLDQQAQPAATPINAQEQRGQAIFLTTNCAYCHTLRGTSATGKLGPDLTHLASRRTLAAATLPNNLENLSSWITDPQHVKPGNLMPATALPSEDLLALLAYLSAQK
jgi:cytochrome c oxidase subunit II